MQILHDGHRHWLTISTIGATRDAEMFVYDSLFNSVTPIVKQQIAAILFTEQNTIDLKVMDVQMQSGSANCGLFAIAFAIALVSSVTVQPGSVVFDQKSMRKHFHDCLQHGRLSVFPILKQRRTAVHSQLKATDSIHVFCICRMPKCCTTPSAFHHFTLQSLAKTGAVAFAIVSDCCSSHIALVISFPSYIYTSSYHRIHLYNQ